MIKIDDLFFIAFIQGLPDTKFQYMKDKLYAENLDGRIPKYADVLATMKSVDL